MIDDLLKKALYSDGDSGGTPSDGLDDPLDDSTEEKVVPAKDPKDPRAVYLRHDLIRMAKERLKKGFYSTEPVLDDLSHEFARALNQRI